MWSDGKERDDDEKESKERERKRKKPMAIVWISEFGKSWHRLEEVIGEGFGSEYSYYGDSDCSDSDSDSHIVRVLHRYGFN